MLTFLDDTVASQKEDEDIICDGYQLLAYLFYRLNVNRAV